ncbi:MAG TPA: c-type cytochrome [Thermoanaerobaculia bacterium]
MSPPITPPEKRPDRHYDFGRMNMVFAVSSLGLLAVTLWMAFADYAQPWKRLQAEFRSLERQKLAKEADAERQRLNQNELAQLKREVAQAQTDIDRHHEEIAKLEDEVKEWKTKRYTAEASWKGAKAVVDARKFEYDTALQNGGERGARGPRAGYDKAKEELAESKRRLEEMEDGLAAAQGRLAARRASLTAAEKKLEALQSGVESIETRIAGLGKGVDYFVLNAPLMDFVRPSLKVEQVILPGLFQNINFTNIDRVDRCMTCHVAANRPGFEDDPNTQEVEWKEPFRSHPRLELFVGDSSPHPYTRFGCTICHGGLDRATDFARAGHSLPMLASTSTKEQRQAWEEKKREWETKWGWEPQKFLDYPILPAGMAEAGCVNCHAGGVWTPKSEEQEAGRELVAHMGCYGCHTINLPGFTGLRKAGPSLLRIAGKTNPGWAYKWIEAPRKFHPTTFMPHFFYQENTTIPVNVARQRIEINAIVSYLWAKSERPVYDDAAVPAGDPARGKQVFETVGCGGCHILDARAKRDDFYPLINRLHGPNLVYTGSKVSRGWLYAWVKNPKQYFPDTNMPNLRLTDQEAADVVAYLLNPSNRNREYENVALPAVDGKLRDELALSYLQNLYTIDRSRAKLAAMKEAERNVYLGEQTIAKYGCYGCHDIKGFENTKPIGTELTAEGSKPLHQLDFGHVHEVPHTRQDWILNKVMHPRMWDEGKEAVKDYNELLKMPDFGASQREAQAVTANVMGFTKESAIATRRAGGDGRTAALAEGRKLITRFNCQGCHLVEGHGRAIKTLLGNDEAKLPPNLASEGARVQGDWLFSYLHDPSRVKMRPWLTVRMPTFGFTDEQANAVISYFAARDQSRPFLSEPAPPDPRSLAVGGVVFGMLQCARCHPSSAEAVTAATGDLAPSLLLAHDRLRYDWVPLWVQNPQFWVPGTRMPNFFPETKPGEYMSPVPTMLNAPTFAAQKQQLLRLFGSEAEMNAYLSDVGRVTTALRDHIWAISGGRRPAAPAAESPAPAAVTAGAAGGR